MEIARNGLGKNLCECFSSATPGTAKFVPPSPASLAPLFPQLEILGLLGHGGMGAVYKARQKKLDRLVALKIIRPEAAADPAFAERFNREARTLARLSHPHIVLDCHYCISVDTRLDCLRDLPDEFCLAACLFDGGDRRSRCRIWCGDRRSH